MSPEKGPARFTSVVGIVDALIRREALARMSPEGRKQLIEELRPGILPRGQDKQSRPGPFKKSEYVTKG